MKRLKKSLAFITTISMLATFSACNSDNKDSSKEETTTEATTEAVTEETTEIPTEKSVELSKTVTFENISYNIDKTWELQNKDEYDLITLKDFSGICIMSSKPKSGDSIPLSDSHVLTMVEMLIEDGQENENYEFDKIDNRNAVSATRKDDNYPEYFFTDGTDIYSITFLGDKNSDAQKYKEDFLKQIKIGVGESTELSETQKLIVDILQSGFESSFGENMKIYYEEDKSNYVISIWQDGVAANLENEAAANAWSAMIDTLVSAVGQMTDPIRQIDSKANVTLNILNDENQKDILLTIYNGEVSYNIIDSETKPKEKTTKKSESDKTVPKEYTNALKKAKSYSDNMYMSKAAIHDQLTSEYGEGFSEEAADYAMENLVADYKANALHKAKSYQDNMAMSTSAIYDQLVSEYGEQFTEEEAQYAIDNLD